MMGQALYPFAFAKGAQQFELQLIKQAKSYN
jgi:hypothetical protein